MYRVYLVITGLLAVLISPSLLLAQASAGVTASSKMKPGQ